MSPEQESEMVRLRLEDRWSFSELGAKYYLGVSTVAKILDRSIPYYLKQHHNNISEENRRTLPRQHKTKLTPQQQFQIVQRYKDGKSTPTLAKEFATSRQVISNVLKRHKVPRRKYSERGTHGNQSGNV